MARSGSFWSDPRLLIVVGLLMMVQWFGGFVWSPAEPPPAEVDAPGALHPTRPRDAEPGALESVDQVLTDTRIRRLNPDGTPRWEPPSAAAVSAAVGGVILFLGGVLSIWSWRRADAVDGDDDAPRPVVRNAADGRWR